jgi:thiol-disulfide isomerase/thioredoxin
MPRRVGALALVLLAMLGACGRTPPQTQGVLGVTYIAPEDRGEALDILGQDLSGAPLSTADSRGAITVVNAWASWCAPCKDEILVLAEAFRRYSTSTAFVGLNVTDESEAARDFERSMAIPYRSIRDADGALLATIPGVPPKALPSTVVLDRQGRIAATIVGPVTRSDLDAVIARISAET